MTQAGTIKTSIQSIAKISAIPHNATDTPTYRRIAVRRNTPS